jgi:glycosyltransferase involved in cell wall biosynthesis
MLEMFASQSQRLEALRSYSALVTHTDHMRKEYIQHGFESERVFKVPFPVRDFSDGDSSYPADIVSDAEPSKLLFLGRMDYLKGGTALIEAVGTASAQLGRPLSLTFGGDGPERHEWEQAAAEVGATYSDVNISFTGWVESSELSRLYAEADLVVLPSLWPEPFGMVGIEAGYFGLPSVAFDVGGIPEWLHDGRNGRLAPGDPPSATGLAETIVDCLRDRSEYQRLSEGAHEIAQHYTPARHVDALTDLFNQTVGK